MAPQQKGKQATKGAKLIVDDNRATLSFYRNMGLAATAVLLLSFYFFDVTKLRLIMGVLSLITIGASYQFMVFMSRPTYGETGALIDSGSDLNMEDGIAEHVKDLIILISGTILMAMLSNYFWLLLLLAPMRAIWMLWGIIIRPWLSQRNDAAQDPDVDEKKQKKMERKMRRTTKFKST